MKLKVLSWNIWGGVHLDRVIEFLKAADADIIALQEVIEDNSTTTARVIANALGCNEVSGLGIQMPAKYLPHLARGEGALVKFGNSILTKHEIIASDMHDLSLEDPRVVIKADIKMGDALLHVFSIHLKHSHQKPLPLQDKQADTLISLLPKEHTIIAGDFNALPDSYAIKKMKRLYACGEGNLTSPTLNPALFDCLGCRGQVLERITLDYIFTTHDLKVHSFEVGNSNGSDHLPVLAEIIL